MNELQVYSNNATTTLAIAINDTDTSITVQTNDGALFPTLSVGPPAEFCALTLEDVAGNIEIVKCTARAGDVFTVERGFDGTTPQSWGVGDRLELRQTRSTNERFVQRDGDVLHGGVFGQEPA